MKRKPATGLGMLVLGLAAPSLWAQTAERPSQFPHLDALQRDWQEAHGASWRVRPDAGTGHARILFGGSAEGSFRPRADADLFELTREHLARAQRLFGVDVQTLVEDHVKLLPLAQVGLTDKLAVQLHEEVGGVPVKGGYVNAIYSLDGRLLSVDHTGLPGLASFDVRPSVSAGAAVTRALEAFGADTGLAAADVSEPVLVITQETVGKQRIGTLTWDVEVQNLGDGSNPQGYRYSIAAIGPRRVVERENLIHFFDVGGSVQAMATPGLRPDKAGNPPAPATMRHMRVSSAAGNAVTDANGNFNISGATGPLNVTFTFDGTFNNVDNSQGAEYSLTVSLTGTGNNVLMNPVPTEFVTAQANAFNHINALRDFIRSVDPSDSHADFVAPANTNIGENCNAFYNGSSTNYYIDGGGCENTAFSTVITHEMGHWLNDRYGTFNGGDGMGEGNADVFAMYVADDPIVGREFCGTGCNIRTGTNTRQYCGDGNGGCYGQVHADGEVHMGAFWKMRRNLKNSLANGGDVANALFLAWLNGYNQTAIDSIIITQLLTLDDDDGIIENGSPNYRDINSAFVEQGFPSFELSFVLFQNTILAQDTQDEVGPFGVAVDVTALQAPSISSVSLNHRVGTSGVYTSTPMTISSGNQYIGLLPGGPSPTKVQYYFQASDSLGNVETLPKDGSVFDVSIGVQRVFFTDNFETAGDNGWTHAVVSNQDDWQHNVPNGSSGSSQGVGWSDPSSAFSGTRIWGNDLGPSGWNGAYMPNTENFLRSPAIDLSGAVGSKLAFRRWLTVEEGIFDQAQIRVNGTTVWSNPASGHVLDRSWNEVEVDISAQADGRAAAQLEWRLRSDGGLELGGWNIDDVRVLTLDATPTDCMPTYYGTGLAGTNGIPTIDTAGQRANIGNLEFRVAVKNSIANATTFVIVGATSASIPFRGGTILATPDLVFTTSTDIFGQAILRTGVPNDGALIGVSLFLQGMVRDRGGTSSPWAFTQGMQAVICN